VATHFEIGMMALNHGKHVLCEKPLAVNEKQVQKLIQTAREKKLFFAEAIWSRYFESYQLLRQRVVNGDLGDIKEIELEFGFPLANTERLFLKNGGGSTLDLATYTIQISLWVFRSEPVKVIAFGKLNEDGLDMEFTGEYHFENGGITKFKVSCLNKLTNNAIIKGSKGQITVSQMISFLNRCHWRKLKFVVEK
jgi:dihydrodiol dehydrogenase / D-xylose 1-dehydrogenase (NADP)